MQLINGKNDLVAGVCWVKKLAKQLQCPLILTGTPPLTAFSQHLHKLIPWHVMLQSCPSIQNAPYTNGCGLVCLKNFYVPHSMYCKQDSTLLTSTPSCCG